MNCLVSRHGYKTLRLVNHLKPKNERFGIDIEDLGSQILKNVSYISSVGKIQTKISRCTLGSFQRRYGQEMYPHHQQKIETG